MEFVRKGVGKAEDFDQLALYVDGRRISDWKTVSSYDDTLTFDNVNYVVKAGQTVKMALVADFANNAKNHQDYFELTKVDASADVEGLPVKGGVFNILNVDTQPAEVSLLAVPNKIARIGEDPVMARVKLVAPNSDAVTLNDITFVNNGTIDAEDLQNFVLYINGEKVGTSKSMYSVR
jgi:hypothetical protein